MKNIPGLEALSLKRRWEGIQELINHHRLRFPFNSDAVEEPKVEAMALGDGLEGGLAQEHGGTVELVEGFNPGGGVDAVADHGPFHAPGRADCAEHHLS